MHKTIQPERAGLAKALSLPIKRFEDKPYLSSRVVKIPLSAIDSSPLHLRKRFDEVSILALADSIRRCGLFEPILVMRSDKGLYEKTHYICVAGERRLRAFKMLGKEEIPCLILSSRIANADMVSLSENLLKNELDMFEWGEAFLSLSQKYSLTDEELAICLSTSQVNVANKIKLLSFTQEEQMFILSSKLTEQHALALLRISDLTLRKKVMKMIAERNYTVKRTQEYIDIILCDLLPFAETAECDDDLETFGKSMNCSLTLLRKNGYAVQCERFEHEDEIQFLIRISTK